MIEEYGVLFAADSESAPDEISMLTGTAPTSWSGLAQRSSPSTFSLEITGFRVRDNYQDPIIKVVRCPGPHG